MSSNQHSDPQPESQNPHWELLRDVARFQAKLLLDGLRDILMSPLSMVAAVAGTLVDRNDPKALFCQVMDLGQRTERWINLFDRSGQQANAEEPGLDELFAILERRVVDQYHRGGATASAKNAIDRSLEGLHRGLDHLKGQSVEDGSDS